MAISNIAKNYDSKENEEQIYRKWESSGYFNPDNLIKKENAQAFSMVIPPPNVTGVLHCGHATMLSIEDLIIRYHRMKGDDTLWIPGFDHAAIATQEVVERKLLKEKNLTKEDLGRERFLKEVKEYAQNSKKVITKQIKKMGSSCDWSRLAYTLDETRSQAVREAFYRMFNEDLIYKGYRIVNWCPRCRSTLADDEVNYKEYDGKLYYIKYGPFVIATTRPETKLGDTGVGVNPDDPRYQKYIGEQFDVNLAGHTINIKVFSDKSIDSEFGTGAVGVTPAHSFEDYEFALQNDLKILKIIDRKGLMTKLAGKYEGLTTKECREAFLSDLEKSGQLIKIEDYKHNISKCYRCKAIIEPQPSNQWFVNVNKPIKRNGKSLKEMAIEAVKKGFCGDTKKQIKIIPKRFNKTYYNWLENLRDWCISRQIWWGHRIPVWYCDDCKAVNVTREKLMNKCEKCGSENIQQDKDTLDTWFSSGLWSFSTLDWPSNFDFESVKPYKGSDLSKYHPLAVMETGYDILFFWVARMIMMTNFLLDDIPFDVVYLHGLVRDKTGVKMSKSRPDYVIDPIDVIDKYGADAVRLSMVLGTKPGNDFQIYDEKIQGFRNFVNKLWNISRYILTNIELKYENKEKFKDQSEMQYYNKDEDVFFCDKTLSDHWILYNYELTKSKYNDFILKHQYSAAGELLRDFTWHKFADWYIEISKIEQNKDAILLYILKDLLKLWHPFIPFVTEKIWEYLNEQDLLMIQKWPTLNQEFLNYSQKNINNFEYILKIITAIRNLRAVNDISDDKKIKTIIVIKEIKEHVKNSSELINKLAKVKDLKIIESKHDLDLTSTVSSIFDSFAVYIPLQEVMDIKNEKLKIDKQINELNQLINKFEKKLSNKEFLNKAPGEIVDEVKIKLEKFKNNLNNLLQRKDNLK